MWEAWGGVGGGSSVGGSRGVLGTAKITQDILDNATAYSGSISTPATLSVVGGKLRATFANPSGIGIPNGFREAGGLYLPVTDLFPGFDIETHDLAVWGQGFAQGPSYSGDRIGIGVSLVDNAAAASAVGLGVQHYDIGANGVRFGSLLVSAGANVSKLAGTEYTLGRWCYDPANNDLSVDCKYFTSATGNGSGHISDGRLTNQTFATDGEASLRISGLIWLAADHSEGDYYELDLTFEQIDRDAIAPPA